MEWYLAVLRQYAVFTGRARRKEFWMFVLFNFLIALGLSIIEMVLGMRGDTGYGPLTGLYTLAVFLPALGVSIRRLHDTGKTGWWVLIGLVPIIGFFVLLFFYIQDSEPGANEHGPNPKGEAVPA